MIKKFFFFYIKDMPIATDSFSIQFTDYTTYNFSESRLPYLKGKSGTTEGLWIIPKRLLPKKKKKRGGPYW